MVEISAAHRCSDAVNEALRNGGMFMWVAIRLSDGASDGIIYPTKGDATRHQLHETQCAYVKVPPDGMTPAHAERFLEINRKLYDAGMRLSDPDNHAILPYTQQGLSLFRR